MTGKGGVGKSSLAAGLGLVAAAHGKKALICEVNADTAMGGLFGASDVGFDPTPVAPGLSVANITAKEALKRFVRRNAPGGRVAELLLRNRIASTFFESAPSVSETVILDQVAQHSLEDGLYDIVIVDLPASGHAVTWMNVPRRMADMMSVGNVAKRIRALGKRIENPTESELVLVTLPEEMPVNETLELWEKLDESIGTPVNWIVINGVHRTRVRDEDIDTLRGLFDDDIPADAKRVFDAVELAKHWEQSDATHVGHLRSKVDARFIEIPFVYNKTHDMDLVRRIKRSIENAWAADEANSNKSATDTKGPA